MRGKGRKKRTLKVRDDGSIREFNGEAGTKDEGNDILTMSMIMDWAAPQRAEPKRKTTHANSLMIHRGIKKK